MPQQFGYGRMAVTVLLALGGSQSFALAQDAMTLPEVVVTAPSPIRRAPAPKPEGVPAPAGPAAGDALPGTLPVVTDQFATVTAVPKEEIERSGGGTLGDLLSNKPGITGSSFAPGASSRPIVRGLDMHRVRVQENGIGSNGASDLGEDHGVPIDPLATERIEVVRGPATLRWGSQAIGGVVDASNNRIPQAVPARGFGAELRGALSSSDKGVDGAVLLDAGQGNFAIHADAYGRKTADYSIPSYPYLFVPGRSFNGTQRNSAVGASGEAVGGSYVFDGGYAGVAVSQFNSLYDIPGIDGEDHHTRIDMQQTKITSKGEFRPRSSAIESIRYWLGHSDYKHNEIGRLLAADPASDGIRQTFTNQEQEGRVEVQLAPIRVPFAALTTAFGVQGWHQSLTAPSPDGAGLFDPNNTTSVAGYMFNEFKLAEGLRTQLAGRIESNRVSGTSPDVQGGDLFSSARTREFAPKSASFGVLKNLPWDLVGSVTAQYVERAPRAPELFSRGPHDATGTFDIGNPNLQTEIAKSLELGLRRAKGPFRFEITAYYTRFGGFIYRQLNGGTCGDDIGSCTSQGGAGGDLNEANYSQRDAIFRGGEAQFQWDVKPLGRGLLGIDAQYDRVRATFTDGTNVPRIPPQRIGGGVYWRDENWFARVGLIHAFAQKDIGPFELAPTSAYNLLKAELSYSKKFNPSGVGLREFTVGIVGDNLLNEDIRNAVSYTKYEVLMPGASVRVFANLKY